MKFYVLAGGDHDDEGAEEAHVLVGLTMKMMEVQSKETFVPLGYFSIPFADFLQMCA